MSVASQSLMDNVTYVDLYKRWEQGNWSAYDIDFSEDRNGWEALSDIQRRSAMWIYSMFYYGEDRVADTLAPYINAAPTEEQSYFLATQQVDEVRHSIFFHRFFKEVIGVGGESIESTLATTLPQLVIYRLLQGICGAALVPLSQSVLLQVNPPERHAKAIDSAVLCFRSETSPAR